ncbi:hypothetical protein [Vulcanisaeta thermophila]|uniref:hypothetical protein n=1 Tax=Vulcanisaeta thermophila TaxID=867917 RepID=UPI000852E0F3|nr:hypothetical protein [Vulcanisaeta thermophila]
MIAFLVFMVSYSSCIAALASLSSIVGIKLVLLTLIMQFIFSYALATASYYVTTVLQKIFIALVT